MSSPPLLTLSESEDELVLRVLDKEVGGYRVHVFLKSEWEYIARRVVNYLDWSYGNKEESSEETYKEGSQTESPQN